MVGEEGVGQRDREEGQRAASRENCMTKCRGRQGGVAGEEGERRTTERDRGTGGECSMMTGISGSTKRTDAKAR